MHEQAAGGAAVAFDQAHKLLDVTGVDGGAISLDLDQVELAVDPNPSVDAAVSRISPISHHAHPWLALEG